MVHALVDDFVCSTAQLLLEALKAASWRFFCDPVILIVVLTVVIFFFFLFFKARLRLVALLAIILSLLRFLWITAFVLWIARHWYMYILLVLQVDGARLEFRSHSNILIRDIDIDWHCILSCFDVLRFFLTNHLTDFNQILLI